VSVRLVKSGVADAICLPLVNIPIYGRIFTTRATEPSMVVVQSDNEDRINASATSV
jgi:hypothetical protein